MDYVDCQLTSNKRKRTLKTQQKQQLTITPHQNKEQRFSQEELAQRASYWRYRRYEFHLNSAFQEIHEKSEKINSNDAQLHANAPSIRDKYEKIKRRWYYTHIDNNFDITYTPEVPNIAPLVLQEGEYFTIKNVLFEFLKQGSPQVFNDPMASYSQMEILNAFQEVLYQARADNRKSITFLKIKNRRLAQFAKYSTLLNTQVWPKILLPHLNQAKFMTFAQQKQAESLGQISTPKLKYEKSQILNTIENPELDPDAENITSISHTQNLSDEHKPKLHRLAIFGNQNHRINHTFPSIEDLAKFPLEKGIKLKQICWRNYDVLKGIQLKFTNQVETPLYQTDKMKKYAVEGALAIKSQDIDTSKTIRKVSVMFSRETNHFTEMQLIDENDEVMNHIVWAENTGHPWTTVDIPPGYEIIGLQVSTNTLDEHEETLEAFGLVMWSPSRRDIKTNSQLDLISSVEQAKVDKNQLNGESEKSNESAKSSDRSYRVQKQSLLQIGSEKKGSAQAKIIQFKLPKAQNGQIRMTKSLSGSKELIEDQQMIQMQQQENLLQNMQDNIKELKQPQQQQQPNEQQQQFNNQGFQPPSNQYIQHKLSQQNNEQQLKQKFTRVSYHSVIVELFGCKAPKHFIKAFFQWSAAEGNKMAQEMKQQPEHSKKKFSVLMKEIWKDLNPQIKKKYYEKEDAQRKDYQAQIAQLEAGSPELMKKKGESNKQWHARVAKKCVEATNKIQNNMVNPSEEVLNDLQFLNSLLKKAGKKKGGDALNKMQDDRQKAQALIRMVIKQWDFMMQLRQEHDALKASHEKLTATVAGQQAKAEQMERKFEGLAERVQQLEDKPQ